MRISVLLLAIALPSQTVWAADWRYCYAASDQDQRFYVSRPFQVTKSMEMTEREWTARLARSAVSYDAIGCPRSADRPGIEAAIQSAIRYNRSNGRGSVQIDWPGTRNSRNDLLFSPHSVKPAEALPAAG